MYIDTIMIDERHRQRVLRIEHEIVDGFKCKAHLVIGFNWGCDEEV